MYRCFLYRNIFQYTMSSSIQEIYTLGTYFTPHKGEDFTNEFKTSYIINIPPDLLLDDQNELTEKKALELISIGKWLPFMDELVLLNLEYYVRYFVPKYFASYMNAHDMGRLYFGIDDDAEITGIPFTGILDSQYIKHLIYNILPALLQYSDGSSVSMDTIRDNIDVVIHNLEIDEVVLNVADVDKQIRHYCETKEREDREMAEYRRVYKVWLEKVAYHRSKIKIHAATLDLRRMTADYIRVKTSDKDVHGNYGKVIEWLESDRDIDVPDNIMHVKHDMNNPVYWILLFRDYMADKVMEEKPEKPIYLPHSKMSPIRVLRRLAPMRQKFIRHNPNLRYYMIEIVINRNKIAGKPVYYRYSDTSDNWKYRIRTVDTGTKEPCCGDFG